MSSYTASEAEEVEVCVRVVSGQLGTDITLQLDTVSGTAVDEDDYTALTRAVTLTPTVTQQCVSVMIEDDSVLEETESLTVSLSLTGAPDSVHLFQQTATIVITDNDKLTVGFTMSSYTVSEAEEEVEVCLRVVSGQLGTDITLQLETISGTAVDEDDYTALTRAVTFTPTVTQQCVSVMIEDDSVFEETESLMVSLSLTGAPDGVQLSQQTAAIVITNDDEVEVEFTNSIYTTNEADTEVEVCVSVVSGQLGANITLQLDSVSETARENVDYEVVSHSVTLTPTTPEACVAIIIMDDKAVELNENLRVSLSQVGKLDGVQIPKDPATVSIQDDDMAMIALEKTRHTVQGGGGGEVGTIEVVDLCVETNSTLERTFVLSVIIIRTSANTTKNTSHIAEVTLTIELHPGDTRACVSLNVSSVDETISFLVQSDELMIANPNGTIIVEPSFDEINNLLQGDNVDIGKVVELLDGIVNDLIANGQTASPEFTGTFVGVVSDVLTISNGQSSDQTERKRRESDDPGTSLLITLDKFALRSFDSSLGVFEDDNLRLQVNDEIGDSSGEPTVTGISGTEDESIDIPTQILQNINSTVTVASYYLRNVGGLLPDTLPEVSGAELVSSVLSSALGCGDSPCDPVVNASEPVRISLRHRKRQGLSEEARCVFYDLNNDSWSEAGCYVNETESADDLTVCYCNHLTHFAVILSPKNSVDEQNAFNLRIIGYVGITISLVCLLLTVVIFCCLKPLWSMRNYIHVNLCVNLIIAQLLFVTGVDKTRYQIVCQSIAVVLHYSFLVTFMWMLMEGVVLYVALVKVFVTKPRRYIISFTVISYGAPLLYMGVVVPLGFLLSDEPHYGGDICWLTSSTHFIWTFIAPVILIILINIGFFFMAIYIIWKQQRRKKLSNSQMNKAKHWLKVSVSLLVIMGISWIVGVLTFHEALLFVSYIFTIVVAFQGALIFILFVVLSKQVRHTLKKWLVRNVINKSSYLSEHFSEFTRSTQAGHTQSHSHSSSHGDKSTLSHGIQLGTFMALPEKSTSISELEKRIEATAPTSLPPTNTPPSSPIPSPQHPTPPSHSPTPQILSEDCKKEDVEMAPCATDSGTDKDSGRSSPDTDAIDTPPPVTLQQHTHVPTVTSKQPTFTEHKLPSTDMH